MEDNNTKQPLLSSIDEEQLVPQLSGQRYLSSHSFTSSFVADGDDIAPITGIDGFVKAFNVESKKLWYLAGPAIFTSVCQYSLGAITQTFAGHIGTLELAAFSIENTVIAGLSYGVMWGMGSALETLCGQAYGAGQIDMLGVYMQRSWVILLATSVLLTLIYVFAEPILLLLGQDKDISRVAARYSLWMIPQLYAYAMNFPIAKFLQAQSKIMAMAWISAVALVLHVLFSWLFMLRLGWGMVGGAWVLNFSWWFIVVGQLVYIFSGTCDRAWSGFSWQAFQNLWGFVKLSMASAVMLCLEIWYLTALLLFAGYLKNAQVAVDALSICLNIMVWTMMLSIGFNAAVSVRVSNELGATHPRTAKFSMVVVVISAFLLSLLISIILLIFQKQYPFIFAENSEVIEVVYQLTPLLAFCIVVNNVQPALSGVAIGAGWQTLVAYVNIACYYIFGIPLGLLMGYTLNMGVQASVASERIRRWGGEPEVKTIMEK
ncbi:hypothetical protein DH2020_015318 [Rehmannia glutinosa]|uniref:Protein DETOXIFICATION n=1 Tax=Rehmannia glutinosa TaxID=99300 RepID=A0ABR0WTV1_REHGL